MPDLTWIDHMPDWIWLVPTAAVLIYVISDHIRGRREAPEVDRLSHEIQARARQQTEQTCSPSVTWAKPTAGADILCAACSGCCGSSPESE